MRGRKVKEEDDACVSLVLSALNVVSEGWWVFAEGFVIKAMKR